MITLIIKDNIGKLQIHLSFMQLFTITPIFFWLFITHVGGLNARWTRDLWNIGYPS